MVSSLCPLSVCSHLLIEKHVCYRDVSPSPDHLLFTDNYPSGGDTLLKKASKTEFCTKFFLILFLARKSMNTKKGSMKES